MIHFRVMLMAAAMATGTAYAQTSKPAAKPASKTATATGMPAKNGTPILTIGKTLVPVHEFEYVYSKNNANAEDAFTDKSVREYVDLYTNFKLKVMNAESLRMDTAAAFKQELEGYRRQLAQPYLTEKSVTDRLVKEVYDRMKQEVKASHILLMVDPQADPKDTLKAFNKLVDLRKRALAGEDFAKLARENSEDPSAKQNDGDLGYFTAMQMVYPFESAAYATTKGQISMPVRTRFGFHIVKVVDKRQSQGQVQVAHIMIKANPGMPAEDSIAARNKVYEIYGKLRKGDSFNTLAQSFSEDQGSKDRGGVLPAFSSGNMIPSFEEASFAIKDTGAYSAPFLTPYGWHIVKLMNRKPLETYEELEPSLKTKVSKDSRSDMNRSVLMARLKKENNLIEFPKVKAKAFAKADTSLLSGKWRYKRADKAVKEVLFTIKGEPTTVGNLYDYIEKSQSANKKSNPAYLMLLGYNSLLEEKMIAYEDAHLSDKYEDYKMLYKEYRDGILLFSLMDQKVWTKALEDTTGVKEYYERNKANYKWEQRADAQIFNVVDAKTLEGVKAKLAAKRFAVAEPTFDAITFDKNANKVSEKGNTEVRKISFALKNDEAMTIEVLGFAAKGEKSGTSRKRAKAVMDSLVKQGIEAKRIMIIDGGFVKDAPKDAKPEASQKVTFAVYNSSLKALERTLNTNNPLAVQTTEGKFQKTENTTLDKVSWKVGDFTIIDDATKGRVNYIVIKALEAPRPKTLDEARGLVISDYQNELEKKWLAELRAQNPVTVNEAEVKKLIRK